MRCPAPRISSRWSEVRTRSVAASRTPHPNRMGWNPPIKREAAPVESKKANPTKTWIASPTESRIASLIKRLKAWRRVYSVSISPKSSWWPYHSVQKPTEIAVRIRNRTPGIDKGPKIVSLPKISYPRVTRVCLITKSYLFRMRQTRARSISMSYVRPILEASNPIGCQARKITQILPIPKIWMMLTRSPHRKT